MPTAKFDLGQAGITDYLILRCRKVADPGTETDRHRVGPAPATVNNFVFINLDPETYFFDLYESVDGTALTTLFGTFTYDAANEKVTNEKRYYVVGSGVGAAPAAGATTLTDSYFAGKNVTAVFQRAFGYLLPTVEWSISGSTITLGGTLQFSDQDVYMVEIDYTVHDTTAPSLTLFAGIKTITSNTTIDSTYYNNRTNCNGSGIQLVITMATTGMPNGKFLYFVDNQGGVQKQTKFVASAGMFRWNGLLTTEIWIGKGEHIWFEKQTVSGTDYFEVVQSHANLLNTGEIVTATLNPMPNTLAEDNALYAAGDYPRLWYWLTHALATNLFVLDDTLDAGGYTRPVNKNGQFIISTTKQKFRMPDTRQMVHKGLKDFSTYGTDTGRPFDYPGGFQDEMVGPHTHPIPVATTAGTGTPSGRTSATGPEGNTDVNTGTETRVKNVGVIFLRRI